MVVDAGHDTFKFGFGGYGMPSLVVPTAAGVVDTEAEFMRNFKPATASAPTAPQDDARAGLASVGSLQYYVGDAATRHRPGMSVLSPLEDGLVSDWDALTALLRHGYAGLGTTPQDHPLLLSEIPLAPQALREALVETLFEDVGVPALYLARTPVLAAMAVGRPTALVLDFGAEHTRVCSVFDGRLLVRSVQQSVLGGKALTGYGDMLLGKAGHALPQPWDPRAPVKATESGASTGDSFTVRFPAPARQRLDGGEGGAHREQLDSFVDDFGTTESFATHARLQAVNDLKKGVSLVNGAPYAAAKGLSLPKPALQVRLGRAAPDGQGSGGDNAPSDGAAASGGGTDSSSKGRKGGSRGGAGRRGTKRSANGEEKSPDAIEVEEEDDDDGGSDQDSLKGGEGGSEDEREPEEATTYERGRGWSALHLEHEARCLGEVLFEPAPLISHMVSGARASGSTLVDFGAVPGLASRLSPVHQATARIMLHRKSRFPRSITTATGTTVFPQPVHRMVHASLTACDPQLRQALTSNIVLTGGGSLMPGLKQRLAGELSRMLPDAFKPRLLAPGNMEQRFGAWVGGSVLSSLGTFQQLWLSRAEYEEDGAGMVERRCL